MRRNLFALTVAVSLIAGAIPRAQDLSFVFFGDYLESLRRQAGIPGLTAVIVGSDGVLWTRSFGMSSVERAIAARSDTPLHVDGITQLITSSLVLRCVEEGRLSLTDRAGQFDPEASDAGATLAQLLSHTSGAADGSAFDYRPDRLAPLARAVEACTGSSFRAAVIAFLDRAAMLDSVPGVDAIGLTPSDPGMSEHNLRRYSDVLQRLATFYAVDKAGRPTPALQHPVLSIGPSGGLVSTADDLAKFDLALKRGVLLKPETLAAAWRPPLAPSGQALPHGLGWFVQGYNGARVVWQFGATENVSSSLVATILPRGLTLILIANSDGLARPFGLSAGDLTASPFGKVFLGTFVR
jgi:CubicO group peptidase (beta-lactamase class C family)